MHAAVLIAAIEAMAFAETAFDRLSLSTPDGGACVALAGVPGPDPKGARFQFSLPGSVQGFTTENTSVATVRNASAADGTRRLALAVETGTLSADRIAITPVSPIP